MIGRIVKPRVYLEGIEIPCYSVTIQSVAGQSASAIVDIPPLEEFFERTDEEPPGSGKFVKKTGVLPRSFVHIFCQDSDDPDDKLRLLFEGEYVKFEYVKDVNRRTIRLIARDLSNLLNSVYVRYYSDFFNPYANLVSAFSGVGTASNPDPTSIKMSLTGGSSLNPEILKALADDKDGFGIASAFRAIIKDALKVNAFFSDFDARTKISKKIAALVDIKSRLLVQFKILEGLILQNMSNLKDGATVWDLFGMLMSLVFYVPVAITSAPYLKKKFTEIGGSEQGSKESATMEENSLVSLLIKPYTWWTAPANFNVIFPSQYKTFRMGRDFLSEPTRLLMSAFGIIESLVVHGERSFAPSQFVFIAPQALADRFDKDLFDTQITLAGRTKTIVSTENEIHALEAQKVDLEKKANVETISSSDKTSLKKDIDGKNGEIATKKDELKKLNAERTEVSVTGVKPATDTSAFGAKTKVSLKRFNRSVMGAGDGVSLVSREDLKGIVFAFDHVTQTQVEVSKSKGIDPNALKNYLSNVASYKLTLQQYKGRFAEVSMLFSPQLVVGFPALVIDPHRNFFGEIESIVHILDADGAANTTITMSFVRNDEIEFGENARNETGKIQFPRWISDSYLPENIDKAVYKTLFPENKPEFGKPGIQAARAITPAYGPNQVLAANEIRRLYFSAKDREGFAAAFTRRNIATAEQVFTSILGAPKVGLNYVVSSLVSERYLAALEYTSKAPPAGVIVRSEDPEVSKKQQ